MVGLLTSDYSIYDGSTIGTTIPGCQSFDQIEWTYNNGQLLSGSAFLYNFVPPSPPPPLIIFCRPTATQPGKPVWTPSSAPPKANSSQTASSGNPPAKQTTTATSTNSVSRVSSPNTWVSQPNSPPTPPQPSTPSSRAPPSQRGITVTRAPMARSVPCGGLRRGRADR